MLAETNNSAAGRKEPKERRTERERIDVTRFIPVCRTKSCASRAFVLDGREQAAIDRALFRTKRPAALEAQVEHAGWTRRGMCRVNAAVVDVVAASRI